MVSDKKTHRGRRIKGVKRTYTLDCVVGLLFVTEIVIAAISAVHPSVYFYKEHDYKSSLDRAGDSKINNNSENKCLKAYYCSYLS